MDKNMNFKAKYEEFLSSIENYLRENINPVEPYCLYEPFVYLISGAGKRIRPVLTMICAGAVGANPDDAIPSAAAVEILHNFTLVHDDIMDKSPLRRGRQTVHTKWNESIAILTGDIMIGYGYKLLPNNSIHKRSDKIHDSYTRGLIEVCEGQGYDVDFDYNPSVTIDDYLKMIEKKTSRLLETAAIIGANIGNASDSQIDALQKYALYFGLAFQIQDDILDLTAEQLKLGKKIGQDILEGKKTFLILKAKEKAQNENHMELLSRFCAEHGLTEDYIIDMQDMFNELGIIEEAKTEIDRYFSLAKNELKKLDNNFYVDMLIWLIDKMNKRDY